MASNVTHIQQVTSVTIPTTTETVVATSDNIQLSPIGGEGYRIEGTILLLVGTGTTSVTIRVRQNSLTGSLVGIAQPNTVTAGSNVSLGYDTVDTAAAATPVGNYVVTLQQTGATANGTVQIATISTAPMTSAT